MLQCNNECKFSLHCPLQRRYILIYLNAYGSVCLLYAFYAVLSDPVNPTRKLNGVLASSSIAKSYSVIQLSYLIVSGIISTYMRCL